MSLCKLTNDVLQLLLAYVESETDKYNFACVNTTMWTNLTCFKSRNYTPLNSRITGFKLHLITKVFIENSYYNRGFLFHVFNCAKHLSNVRVSHRDTFAAAFFEVLIECFPSNSSIILELHSGSKTAWYEAATKVVVPKNLIIRLQRANNMATTHVDDLNATEVNPDLILTPESVRIKCEEIKRELKVQYARSNLYKLKNSVQNMLPSYVNKICTLKNYNLFENDIKSHSSMAKNRKLNHSEANEIVNHYSKLFIESIVILNDCWFAITSFDVFVHHNKKIDDCADDSKIAYQAKPIAYIRRKNKFKTDYFELSIRLGELESLVTGGFRGQLNDAKNTIVPFLGSSIPNLPDSLIGIAISPSTPSVFVLLKEHQDTPIFTNRTVNQFLKDHSMNRWAIHSSRFHKDGFYPANPVYFKSRSIYHEASSLLLRMYAEKRVILGELDEMLKEIKDRGQKPNSNTTKKIVSLLEFTRSRFSEVTHIRLNSVELSKKREELIEIFNSSLYKALKASNDKKVAEAKEKYAVKKRDIFSEDSTEEDGENDVKK